MSRRFQFSLRALLLLITATCAWLGWHVRTANRPRDAIAAIEQMGGSVAFDEDGVTPFMVTFHQSDHVRNADGTVTMPTEWRNGLYTVGPKITLTDDGLKHVSSLSNVRYVLIGGLPITDAGLRRLQPLKKLKHVRLARTQATAAGIAELQKALPNCKIEWYPASSTAMGSK